jgi:hypothetical protein
MTTQRTIVDLERENADLRAEVQALLAAVHALSKCVIVPGQTLAVPAPVAIPYVAPAPRVCADDQHDFPAVWHAIVPPSCRRCGYMWPTQTFTTGVTNAAAHFPDCFVVMNDAPVPFGNTAGCAPAMTSVYLHAAAQTSIKVTS